MQSPLHDKSKAFAIRVVKMTQLLSERKKEFVLSKQILKSGTSIGANVRESKAAQSKPDFISKLSIALKESYETEYWLELIHETGYIGRKGYISMKNDLAELISMLSSSIQTSKRSLRKAKSLIQ